MATEFISYSHIDSEVADEIAGILAEQQIEFFRDVKNIEWGDSINSEVRLGLEEARALVVIVSPASLNVAIAHSEHQSFKNSEFRNFLW